VLVIASGEILVPGDIHWGLGLGLPRNVAFAGLGETILPALEGRKDNFTLGREIDAARLNEIGEIWKKHGFKLAPMMALGKEISGEEIERIRRRAARSADFQSTVPRTFRSAPE
jgi:hypothetical protein